MRPLQAWGELGAMAVKEYSAFTKAPALQEPHHQIIYSYTGHSFRECYSFAEMQLVYPAAPANWASLVK